MHIHEIVVDGFKSYAHRTVIAGFDPHFNAITGLNGSGKSNILDSICFVLGITNLSHVRAGNLSELVYKQGQAGVNKASVTVVFDNADAANGPVGYESDAQVTVTRQVLIGGKSKYLINGRVAPANKVTNLFHSVQLNVNNPHFLIMQGRITKVLNMKPHEILSMVEEAAGTRMYETKRVAALKTIEKKQTKLDELNGVLREGITPTLVRLRGEKMHYLKWSKNNSDIERIERFVIAHEYLKGQQTLTHSEEEARMMQEEITKAATTVTDCDLKIEEKDSQIEQKKLLRNNQFDPQHKKLKATEEALSKELVKVTATWKNCTNVAKTSDLELTAARQQVEETQLTVKIKEQEIQQDMERIKTAKATAEHADSELVRLQEEHQNMCAGISSTDSQSSDMTLPDQISKAHNDANNAEARAKQANMKIKHLTKSLNNSQREMKKEEKSAAKLNTKRETALHKVTTMQAQLSTGRNTAFGEFNQTEFHQLETEKINLTDLLSNLGSTVHTLTAQLEGRLAFHYADPVRGFDRSKVKGLVARLIQIKRPDYATALEVVAGGKLFQVVVDEAVTGKALLSRGRLQRRVTIIPLDKITSRNVSDEKRTISNTIAAKLNTTAAPAIEFLGFDEEIRNAVEYVFGSTLLVDGMDAANKICDVTKTRTVTKEGDVYDPSGTISGGSNKNLSTLTRLTALMTATTELNNCQLQLDKLSAKYDCWNNISVKYGDLSDNLELATAELASVDKQLSQTSYGMIAEQHNAMFKEVTEAKEEVKAMELEKTTKWDLYNNLKEKEADLTKQREDKLKRFDDILSNAKKHVADATRLYQELDSASQKLVFEVESLKQDLVTTLEAVQTATDAVNKAASEEVDLQIKVGEQKALYDEAKNELKNLEQQIHELETELKKLGKERSSLTKQAETARLESKKLEVRIGSFQKGKQHAERVVTSLMKKYSWIESEMHSFGVVGGDYDFDHINPIEMGNKLKNLKEEQTSLTRKINKKVMGMIEKAEGEYTELLRKIKVVENDKKKIQAVIENLDVKKKSELERTWVKVNGDFGDIFSTLLPGASAKLEPPEGLQAWEGLEVKVAFGGVWKESLSELSGGQRSLLALSLILSLLLFKPAPMYILDEVDAALDLSHTQNIGNMLKTHFSQSQFIVVSLKEGMFNNANVIFRTKFVDGVSTVTKTMGTGASVKGRRALSEANHTQQSETESPARKRNSGRSRRQPLSAEKEN